MPSGPTFSDIMANIAFFVGLMHNISTDYDVPEKSIDFATARDNFYACAKDGLNAKITWKNGRKFVAKDLILENLLPRAIDGLNSLGSSNKDIDLYLKDIIYNRIKTEQNGASWQRKFVAKHGQDFQLLTKQYIENQRSSIPVHEWKV